MTIRDLVERYDPAGDPILFSIIHGSETVCEFNSNYAQWIRDELLNQEVKTYVIKASRNTMYIIPNFGKELAEKDEGESNGSNDDY